jgi:putative transposase
MSSSAAITELQIKIASVLRALGNGPLTCEQALLAAQLLDVHWTHVYHLRRWFLASPVTTSLATHKTGRRAGHRLNPGVEAIVQIALRQWMPQQNHLAHQLLDLCSEIGQRCTDEALPQPSRNTGVARWSLYRDE